MSVNCYGTGVWWFFFYVSQKSCTFALRFIITIAMNPNTEYERFTQEVYQQLLNCRHPDIANVQHNIKLDGRSGCKHQIDVYWEYEKDGVKHRVAIECKNYSKHVPKEKVCAFHSKISDLDGVEGIMVSKKGFQSGAIQYAKAYGISLQELREPEGEETIIGNMALNFHIEKRSTLFAADEQWAKEHNIDIPEYKRRMDMISFTHEYNWSNASHIPLELADWVIRDADGKEITTLDLLEQQIPDHPTDDFPFVFPFDDAYVKTPYWGLVKILEIKYTYETEDQQRNITIDASDFVKAILKDAFGDDPGIRIMRPVP